MLVDELECCGAREDDEGLVWVEVVLLLEGVGVGCDAWTAILDLHIHESERMPQASHQTYPPLHLCWIV